MENVLIDRLYIFATSSLIFCLFLFLALRNGYFSDPRKEAGFPQKISTKALLGGFALFLLLEVLVAPLTFEIGHYFYQGDPKFSLKLSPHLQGWFTIYAIVITGAGLLFYFFCLSKEQRQSILGTYASKGWIAKIQDVFIACLTWVLSYPLMVAIGQGVGILVTVIYQNVEPEQVAVKQIKMASTSTFLWVVLTCLIVSVVPCIEEFLFRGLFQNWLKRFMSKNKAIVLAAGVFAIFHFSPTQGLGNLELIVSLFVFSCFLGYIYERQKSLWAPISLHALFNAISIVLIFLVEKKEAGTL